MLRKLSFLFFAAITVNANAQKQKLSVGISEFISTGNAYPKAAAELQDIVLASFVQNGDFELLDRTKTEAIQKELGIQKGKDYVKGKTVKQNEAHGADMLILGKITSIDTQKLQITDRLPGAGSGGSNKLVLNYSLQAVDVRTGAIRGYDFFTIKGSFGQNMNVGGVSTETGNAVRTNQQAIMAQTAEWINKIFPPRLVIDEINKKTKKGLPDVITIMSSHKLHVTENTILEVNEISERDMDGDIKIKVQKIAELRVLEPQGDFIKCEVSGGAKELADKLETNPKALFLELSDKKPMPQMPNPFKKG